MTESATRPTPSAGLSAEHPFPGLRPFGFADRAFFFGREDQAYALFRLFDYSQFVAVIGASGSGKSSLVRAGLLRLLYEEGPEGADSPWRFATLQPGDAPIRRLAEALGSLVPPAVGSESDADNAIILEDVELTLRGSSFGVVKSLREMRQLDNKRVLLVVDQFEELFRYGSDARNPIAEAVWRDETAAFVQLLLEATRDRSLSFFVLITMRSDFIGECARFRDLPEAVSATQFLVPSLTREQLEDAIRRPIAEAKAVIDDELVERLLSEAGNEIDELPVLQHCLFRIWETVRAKLGRLDSEAYAAIGGLAHALSEHADEVMADLIEERGPGMELVVQQVFRALSERDSEGRAIRRTLSYEKLCAETGEHENDIARALDKFRATDCSFIVPSRVQLEDLKPQTRLDVAHEALLRRWKKLSADPTSEVAELGTVVGWIVAEDQDGRFYRALLELLRNSPTGEVILPLDQVEDRERTWRSRNRTAAWAARYGGELPLVEKIYADSRTRLEESEIRAAREEQARLDAERRKIEEEEAAKRVRLEHELRVEQAELAERRAREIADRAERERLEQRLVLSRKLRRTQLIAVALLGLALVAITIVIGQSRVQHLQTTISQLESSTRLTFNVASDPASLDPILLDRNSTELQVERLIFEPFVDVDSKGELVPVLLASIPDREHGTISSDGRRITYSLRRGLKWHDGQDVTSSDVKFTWRAIMYRDNPVVSREGYDRIDSIDIDRRDPWTAVVTLKKPWAPAVATLFSYGAGPSFVIPQHVFGGSPDLSKAQFNATPVGDGPYRLTSWQRGSRLELSAFQQYWRGVPPIPSLRVNITPAPGTNFAELLAGELSWNLVAPLQRKALEGRPGIGFAQQPQAMSVGLAFNLRREALRDVRVRRAIAMSIDRNAISRKVTLNAYPVIDTDQPILSWARDQAVKLPPYDPQGADRLLEAAGWHLTGDTRQKDGLPLSLAFVYFQESDTSSRVAVEVQSALRQRGIDVTLKSVPQGQFFLPAPRGTLWSGRYDMAYIPWQMGTDPDDSAIAKKGGSANYMGYENPTVDALEDRVLGNVDEAQRKPIYARIQQLMAQDVPVIWLFNPTYLYAYRLPLANFEPNQIVPTWNAWSWARYWAEGTAVQGSGQRSSAATR